MVTAILSFSLSVRLASFLKEKPVVRETNCCRENAKKNHNTSPASDAAGVEVNEIRPGVVTDSSPAQNQGSLLKLGQVDAAEPDVHRFTLHMQAVASYPAAPPAEHSIGLRGPVGRDDLYGSGSAEPS